MSSPEQIDAATEFAVAELRAEGVNVSEEMAKEVMEDFHSRPLHELVPPPPGHVDKLTPNRQVAVR